MSHKIAYVMSRFPHLPETFILREMVALERRGYTLSLYPLIVQEQPVIHEDARAWLPRANKTPFFSLDVLKANGRFLRRQPARLATIWQRVIRENLSSPNFLSRALLILPQATQMAAQMQAEGITHIHAHYASHPALAAWIIHQLTGISYSLTVHAHDIFVRKTMLGTKLADATFIAAISEFNRDYLAADYGDYLRDKMHIVRCGVLPETYEAQPRKWQAGEPLEIISIGSLQPYKGQRFLVDALAQLRDQGIPFRCRIIGEGELRPELEQQIESLNLTNQIILLGAQPQDEVARLLATAHCYVQPSIITPQGKMEGIPVSLMEALVSQLPVIASRLSGIPELVKPGKTGYLVSPADSEALATTFAHLYAHPEEAASLAANGRFHVLSEFELTQNVEKLDALFDHYLASTTVTEVAS